MDWIEAIYLLTIVLIIFILGFLIGGTLGMVSEKARWWERQARVNRNVDALVAPSEQQPEDEFPAEIDAGQI